LRELRQIIAEVANFLRGWRGATPDPIIRKAVIHLGMPKAASTSIQLALHGAQNLQLVENGIWFTPPDGAFNDSIMYDMLLAGDAAALSNYVERKTRAAADAGADVVIFSAERLFTIDDVQARIAQLATAVQPYSAEVSFAVVAREISAFLRSYITQMVYNADVTLDDHGLGEWLVDQIGLISECRLPIYVIPLEREERGRNIAEQLIRVTTGREVQIPLTRANVTPSRPLLYALAEGLVARIAAIEAGGDINATELDEFRTEFANAYDQSVHTTSDPGEVYRVLQRLNQVIEVYVAEYIDRCIRECPVEKLSFYDEMLTTHEAPELSILEHKAAQDFAAFRRDRTARRASGIPLIHLT
jgi:hypothetical protein